MTADGTNQDDASAAGHRVIIFGSHSLDWMTALAAAAPVWPLVRGVREVMLIGDNERALLPPDDGSTVIIPLMERHLIDCPRSYRSLFPDPSSVRMLADKAAFAAYVVEQGLGALCPLHYANADATFPCVLKRLDLNAGRGIVRVQSEQELHDLLGREPWLGKPYLLQQYIPSGDDYVTHAVLRNGQIIWHRSYRYAINPDDPIRGPANTGDIEKTDPPAAAIAQLNRFLAPLGYNGPVNVDYRFADNGALKVIEINPRLGGSLMRPDNLDDLAEMLSTIIENAT